MALSIKEGPVKCAIVCNKSWVILTLGGEKITLIKIAAPGDVQISYLKNYINVVKGDIMADNGVIHVIDKVILPPSKFHT